MLKAEHKLQFNKGFQDQIRFENANKVNICRTKVLVQVKF